MIEAAHIGDGLGQRIFPAMPEGRMADIMGKA
jgi:hypothetical protein